MFAYFLMKKVSKNFEGRNGPQPSVTKGNQNLKTSEFDKYLEMAKHRE